jgi:hypothetical protein
VNVSKDFEELFALLRKHRVEFVIVGGYAVTFHTKPRFFLCCLCGKDEAIACYDRDDLERYLWVNQVAAFTSVTRRAYNPLAFEPRHPNEPTARVSRLKRMRAREGACNRGLGAGVRKFSHDRHTYYSIVSNT